MVVAKGRSVFMGGQIFVQRLLAHGRQVTHRFAIEAQEIAQHRPEAWLQDIARLGEKSGDILAGVFIAAAFERNREGHVRWRRRHAERLEQLGQIGIAGLVIDNEAGVDGDFRVFELRIDGMAVSADAGVRLEHRDPMMAVQQPRAGKAGNACPHDRYGFCC